MCIYLEGARQPQQSRTMIKSSRVWTSTTRTAKSVVAVAVSGGEAAPFSASSCRPRKPHGSQMPARTALECFPHPDKRQRVHAAQSCQHRPDPSTEMVERSLEG